MEVGGQAVDDLFVDSKREGLNFILFYFIFLEKHSLNFER